MPPVEYKPKRQGIAYPSPTNKQWRRILRKCTHVNTGHNSPCWIWGGRIDSDGYGECKYNGEKRFVHRISYARKAGIAPARRDVDHICRQRACCNPAHLRAVQPLENATNNNPYDSPIQVNRNNLLDFIEKRGTVLVPF